jgi:hypothetical protein
MRKNSFNRMRIAHIIYDLFPTKFCWADLVSWGLGYKSFFSIFLIFGKPHGCVTESMEKVLEKSDCENCYCGCWCSGHHYSSEQGKKISEKVKADQKTPRVVEGL